MVTDSAPIRMRVRAASTATFPPPITTAFLIPSIFCPGDLLQEIYPLDHPFGPFAGEVQPRTFLASNSHVYRFVSLAFEVLKRDVTADGYIGFRFNPQVEDVLNLLPRGLPEAVDSRGYPRAASRPAQAAGWRGLSPSYNLGKS